MELLFILFFPCRPFKEYHRQLQPPLLHDGDSDDREKEEPMMTEEETLISPGNNAADCSNLTSGLGGVGADIDDPSSETAASSTELFTQLQMANQPRRKKDLRLPLLKPNCAAFFFEHGTSAGAAAAAAAASATSASSRSSLNLEDHDSGLENNTPEQVVDAAMDIKELVTRADELVKSESSNRSPVDAMAISTDSHYTFLTSLDSRDASGEEDEMSCGSGHEQHHQRHHHHHHHNNQECDKCSSSSESSCSHDVTITSSSASGALDNHARGCCNREDDIMSRSMHEQLNPSVFGATTGKRRKMRRRSHTKKQQLQLPPNNNSSSSSSAAAAVVTTLSPLSQSTPVKNNGNSLVVKKSTAETDEDQEELEEEEVQHQQRDEQDEEVLETSSMQQRRKLSDEISEAELSEYWDQVRVDAVCSYKYFHSVYEKM